MAVVRAGVLALSQRVYAVVPANPQFPYATFSTPSTIPIDEDMRDRCNVSLQVDVWSNQLSDAEAKTIAATIRNMLHEKPLSVVGYTADSVSVRGIFPTKEEGGAINRARIMVEVDAQPA